MRVRVNQEGCISNQRGLFGLVAAVGHLAVIAAESVAQTQVKEAGDRCGSLQHQNPVKKSEISASAFHQHQRMLI